MPTKPYREMTAAELETELLIEQSAVETYKHTSSKSSEMWKAVEKRNQIQTELKKKTKEAE